MDGKFGVVREKENSRWKKKKNRYGERGRKKKEEREREGEMGEREGCDGEIRGRRTVDGVLRVLLRGVYGVWYGGIP